jgi:hypothetical protein
LEGVGKEVTGTVKMVQASANAVMTYTPLLVEGISVKGTEEATAGVLDALEENSSVEPIKVPYTPEYSAAIQDAPLSTSKAATNEAAVDYEALYQKYKADRPKLSQKTINEVWENAKDADGNVYDPNTGEKLTWDKFKSRREQWHMGHKSGLEYRTLLQQLREGKITEAEFKAEFNKSANYQPESPSANMSHKYEQKSQTNEQTQTQSQTGGN